MLELTESGGWVLGAIGFLSLLAWWLIVLKWLQLRAEAEGGPGWTDETVERIRQGRVGDARDLSARHASLPGRLLRAALEVETHDRRDFEKHMRPLFDGEVAALGRHLSLIGLCGRLAPLLGLLGTVVGMLHTFQALAGARAVEVAPLTGGISEALLTTQAGLVAALPIVLAHGWLRSRVRRRVQGLALLMKKVETAREDTTLNGERHGGTGGTEARRHEGR